MNSAVLILLFSVNLCFAQPQSLCPRGEIWRVRGTCEPTCAEPNLSCPEECHPAGCQCSTGLVRDPITRTCIKPELCNVNCPFGEVWNQCATCEPTCADPNPVCTRECRPAACQCAPGLVRNPITRTCTTLGQCRTTIPRCGFNEVYSECGTMCPPRCDIIRGVIVRAEACAAVCVSGCQCAPGYVSFSGVCLPETICRRYY